MLYCIVNWNYHKRGLLLETLLLAHSAMSSYFLMTCVPRNPLAPLLHGLVTSIWIRRIKYKLTFYLVTQHGYQFVGYHLQSSDIVLTSKEFKLWKHLEDIQVCKHAILKSKQKTYTKNFGTPTKIGKGSVLSIKYLTFVIRWVEQKPIWFTIGRLTFIPSRLAQF